MLAHFASAAWRKAAAVVAVSGILVFVEQLGAQSSSTREHVSAWTTDVGVGGLWQPHGEGGAGPGFVLSATRRVNQGPWSLSATVIAARVADAGAPGPNRYIIDRDWVTAMVGTSVPVIAGKFGVSMDLAAGPLWSRDRQAGTRGTPLTSQTFGDWEAMAGMLVGTTVTYRLSPSLRAMSRLALVQHIFTDDFLGASGGLTVLGVAYSR
ncbi:MAG TPA: hypothetical protein VFT29_09825 [Gemmatimonadaceae bacterium]|nr:hypothetical protein [Gemmatimonadaceae bacterium]